MLPQRLDIGVLHTPHDTGVGGYWGFSVLHSVVSTDTTVSEAKPSGEVAVTFGHLACVAAEDGFLLKRAGLEFTCVEGFQGVEFKLLLSGLAEVGCGAAVDVDAGGSLGGLLLAGDVLRAEAYLSSLLTGGVAGLASVADADVGVSVGNLGLLVPLLERAKGAEDAHADCCESCDHVIPPNL